MRIFGTIGASSRATFLRLWAIGALGSTGRWLDSLVYALLVVDAGGGAFEVTALMLARTLPLALFGWVVGRVAERLAPRTALVAGAGLAGAVAIAAALLAAADAITIPVLLLAAFAGGLVWAADLPVRRVSIGEVVGADNTARAMSLDTVAGSATRAIGPLTGGVLFAWLGAAGALGVSAALHGAALWVALGIASDAIRRPANAAADNMPADSDNAPLAAIAPLAVIRGSILAPVFVLTVLFNLFAYPLLSLVPLFGKAIYGLTPAEVGLLVALEGVASTCAAVLLVLAVPAVAARRVFTCAAILFTAGGIGLAAANGALFAAVAIATMGFALAAFASMQSALVLANAPPGQARRMMGVLSICIGTGPLGYLGLGALAEVVGAAQACAISALVALVALGLIVARWPGLLAPQPTGFAAQPTSR